jgi:hypothetical protein
MSVTDRPVGDVFDVPAGDEFLERVAEQTWILPVVGAEGRICSEKCDSMWR